MPKKATTIVRMESFQNLTPTGRRSATGARKLAMYLAYGRGRGMELAGRDMRGQWFSQGIRLVSHQSVLDWVLAQGKQQTFTHQFILSLKEGQPLSEEYCQAMQAGGDLFSNWHLIRHTDAKHSHAHVLAFGQREIRIKDPLFQEWCQKVRYYLEQMQERWLEQQQALSLKEEITRTIHQEIDQELGLGLSNRLKRQLDKDLDEELGRGWGMGY